MSCKRRFGISIPAVTADKLDKLAEYFKCDRSSIVANAIEEYMHESTHDIEEHVCTGVIVFYSNKPIDNNLTLKYADIVKAQCTFKLGDGYVASILVEGISTRIIEFRKELLKLSKATRFLPLDMHIARKGSDVGKKH
ncbi:MAG: CopG family transcriptional regulator [Desulfurococcaceae archaeon]